MHFKEVSSLLVLAVVAQASMLPGSISGLVEARHIEARQNNNNGNKQGGGNNGGNNGGTGNAALQLDPQVVQTGSQSTGQTGTITPGQVESATDPANFINFCKGKALTNGLQNRGGSCNGIVMGDIPSANNMISSMFIFPAHNDNIAANKDFDVTVQVNNLQAGSFTNAQATYYSAPQKVNAQGNIIGHCHITCQDLGGSLNPGSPPNPSTFAFFKGINDNGNGQGRLKATVTGGLPAGSYRCCTMNSASNHQPVLMPVAQRGAQDDCVKFTVGGNGATGGNGAGNGAGGNGQGAGNGGTANGNGNPAKQSTGPTSTASNTKPSQTAKNSVPPASKTTAPAKGGFNGGFKGGRGGRGGKPRRFSRKF